MAEKVSIENSFSLDHKVNLIILFLNIFAVLLLCLPVDYYFIRVLACSILMFNTGIIVSSKGNIWNKKE